jgi:hypothetical protein
MDNTLRTYIVEGEVLDTGIGREAGFKDDAELVEHARREREALDPDVRELVDEIDRRFAAKFLNG